MNVLVGSLWAEEEGVVTDIVCLSEQTDQFIPARGEHLIGIPQTGRY
jgi:hypothetical protein